MVTAAETHAEGLFDEPVYQLVPNCLSASGAKTLLASPAQYRWEREHPAEPTDAMEFGTAVHAHVLGTAAKDVVWVDADSWRGRDAQAARSMARVEGQVPLLAKQRPVIEDMVEALYARPLVGELLTGGRPEVSAYAVDEPTGVMRRARLDYLREDIVVEYKTTADADPRAWRASAYRYGYPLQAAFYQDICRALGLGVRGMVFVVQAKTAPYQVACVELVPSAVNLGREDARAALDLYAECTASGSWPDYTTDTTDIVPVDVPDWAYREHLFREVSIA